MSDQTTQPDDMEALIQQMAALGISPEALGLMTHQIGRGQSLMDTPMAQGRQVGNTYVASSPLEHLANALRMRQGAQMANQATQGYQGQLGQNRLGLAAGGRAQASYLQQMIDDLRRRQQGQPGAADLGIQPATAPMPIE